MKLDDVLEMLESESTDERKARRKAAYFELIDTDDKHYHHNRRSKRAFDDETDAINRRNKRTLSHYDRSKRL